MKPQLGPIRQSGGAPAGPATHYELFAGLRGAGVSYLLTGATAIALHGVPRLTADIDLLVDPDAENLGRLERLLESWGYGENASPPATPAGAAVRRFRNPRIALEEIDAVIPSAAEFARLRAGAASVPLVDLGIPLVGADDLRACKAAAGDDAGRADVEGLEILAAVQSGAAGDGADTRCEQIRKFSRWSIAARCDWLLASARLGKGLSPEAKPLTRGLVRRRGWFGGRNSR